MKPSIYETITSSIIQSIESDPGHLTMPRHRTTSTLKFPVNVASKNDYRGINILSLWVAGQRGDFATPLWGSYRQWAALGAQVRKARDPHL